MARSTRIPSTAASPTPAAGIEPAAGPPAATPAAGPPPDRGLYCNRTLNLRSIRAIGYDMDYTLIHYRVDAWEGRAYAHVQRMLRSRGWPVGDLAFDPTAVIQGLIIDRELGNVVKANRHGYITQAAHGTRMLDFDAQRRTYGNTLVDLSAPRWVFLNTLFSLSETTLYAQLVDLLDDGALPPGIGYAELYDVVRYSIDAAHVEGELKAEIIADPDRFVELDPDTPLTLLDQRAAGKKLLLITNSEWHYTRAMMAYAFDRFLPAGMTWRDVFDVTIVAARKPAFFHERMPLFEVVDDSGLLRPVGPDVGRHRVFLGGNASLIEAALGVSGGDILYVGDHMFGDVHAPKGIQRWRTALVLRELEADLAAEVAFAPRQAELSALMEAKIQLEFAYSQLRLDLARQQASPPYGPSSSTPPDALQAEMAALRARLVALDERIAPLAIAAGGLNNPRWGLVMRAGNDKSYLAHQVERHADVYLSRVSNFLFETPYVYLRARRGNLPHDRPGLAPPLG